MLFAVIAWGDYADGIAARVTGQYSRLGALMDPVTDRLLVVSGVVVCWHFQLLPRWAIAVLAARELAMLALGRYGLTRGVELRINWPGRLAVAPVMGAFFFAMVGLRTLGEVLLYVGLALALVATGLYVRDGSAAARARTQPVSSARLAEPGAGRDSQAQPDLLVYTRGHRRLVDSALLPPCSLRPAQVRERRKPRWRRSPTSAR